MSSKPKNSAKQYNKSRTLIICTVIVLVVLIGWAFKYAIDHAGDGSSTAQLENALEPLNEWYPAKDVEKNVRAGDLRFVGVWGEPHGPFFPGVPPLQCQSIRNTGNYRAIPGTTDAIESRYHHRLIDRAHQYATRYNTELLSKLKKTNASAGK